MNKHLAAALLTASVAGAGFTGFTITSALAEDDGAPNADVSQVQLEENQDGARADSEANREARAQNLADALGISVEDLMTAREAGQTPAEIAEDNGVSRDDLVAALVEDKQDRLAEKVEAGDLTQDEADEKAADIEEHVNAFIDGEGRQRGRGHGGPNAGADDSDPAGNQDGAEDDTQAEA